MTGALTTFTWRTISFDLAKPVDTFALTFPPVFAHSE
jgi:hypothetical protein